MSAAEMTANGGKVPSGVARLVDDAISELHMAQRLLRTLQDRFVPGGDMTVDAMDVWHRLEAIDDRLHNALAKLGE